MMNTLANHNFLPHDGRNITRDKLIRALGEALNFHPSLASLMFDMAIVVNPEPNATWFTLYVFRPCWCITTLTDIAQRPAKPAQRS